MSKAREAILEKFGRILDITSEMLETAALRIKMSKGRKATLKEFERILDITSEMLETATLRNLLLKESSQKEQEFRKHEREYFEFVDQVETFVSTHEEIVWDKKVSLTEPVRTKYEELKENVKPHLESLEQAGKFAHKIEEYKEQLSSFKEVYQNLKLKKEEIPKDKLYELVALLLLANENDYSISEDSFFESREDLYDLIQSSQNKVLIELLDNANTENKMITELISLDMFLEKV